MGSKNIRQRQLSVKQTRALSKLHGKETGIGKSKTSNALNSRKKANLLLEMSSSPRTRKILIKKGIMRTPEDAKEVEALIAIAQDLREGPSVVKSDKTNSGRAAYTAAKSLAV